VIGNIDSADRLEYTAIELHALHGPAGISSDKSIGALQAD
jgi:hypothetical protein